MPAPTAAVEIPPLTRGPMTTQHLMRWSAAIENWHRIHYDTPFATGHDGLPDLLVNGSWKQHVLVQMLKDWVGHDGWVAELDFRYRSADLRGDTLTAFGEVTERYEERGRAVATASIGIRNQRGEVSTVGTASVVPAAAGADPAGARTLLADRPMAAVDPAGRVPSRHVTPDMLERIGVPGKPVYAPEPVDAGSIRRMAQAIMDDDPVYRDADTARAAGLATLVAPPLFALHIHRRHPGEPDPLGAAIANPDDDGAGDVVTKLGLAPLPVGLTGLLNGGNRVRILDLARVGDTLCSRSTISDLREKRGRSGPLVLVQIDTDYRAANRDALLLRSRQTYIYR